MKILVDSWIPVQTRSGKARHVSATCVADADVLEIEAIRPDFRGAVYQFLIGLLQVACAPQDLDEWRRRYANPPSREELEQFLAPYAQAFELQSDGPAFMQDFALKEKTKQLSVAGLLIDAGSDSNLYFNKPSEAPGFCPSCFAQALFTLQVNAPSGGRGIRTSLRGGGPLTTLLQPADEKATLWQKLWLNVLPQDALGYEPVKQLGDALPWMAPTRISEGAVAKDTTPETVHPLQAWWSMPRRIRIDASTVQEHGQCALCGAQDVRLIRHYLHRRGGTNYTGAWQHPLTPYYLDKKGEKPPISAKGHQAGRGYRDWLGLVLGNEDHQPDVARVVGHFNGHVRSPKVRLWCFGYATSNMKALCWYETQLPVHAVEPDVIKPFTASVKQLLDAADEMARTLHKQVKAAWFKRPGDVGAEPAVPQSFWQNSESAFYAALDKLAAHDFDSSAPLAGIYEAWLRQAYGQVLSLFDHWAMRGSIEDLDLKRVVQARADLVQDLNKSKALKPLWEVVNRHKPASPDKPSAKGKTTKRKTPLHKQADDATGQKELFS